MLNSRPCASWTPLASTQRLRSHPGFVQRYWCPLGNVSRRAVPTSVTWTVVCAAAGPGAPARARLSKASAEARSPSSGSASTRRLTPPATVVELAQLSSEGLLSLENRVAPQIPNAVDGHRWLSLPRQPPTPRHQPEPGHARALHEL